MKTMPRSTAVPLALPLPALARLLACSGLALAAFASGASAQMTVPVNVPPKTGPSSRTALPPPVTESERRFRDLSEYIRARGDIDFSTREDIARVAKELDDDLAKPGNPIATMSRLLAARVQTAIWLDDRAARDSAFERLAAFQANKDPVLLAWARELVACADFERALAILNEHTFGAERLVDARILLANCLLAINRFDEAQSAINTAPTQRTPDQLAQIGNLTGRITTLRDLWNKEMVAMAKDQQRGDLPIVEIVTAKGPITIELFEDQAPNTVGNFIEHVEAGTYNGTRFHRILRGFGVQGGDPATASGGTGGTGSGGWTIPDETINSGKRPTLLGRIVAVLQPKADAPGSPQPHSAGCQFMILLTHAEQLNLEYTAFGRVTDGLDLVRDLTADDEIVSARVISKRSNKEYTGARFSTEATGDFSMPQTPNVVKRSLETKVERPVMPQMTPGAGGAAPGMPVIRPAQPTPPGGAKPPSSPGGVLPTQNPTAPVKGPPPLLTPNGPVPVQLPK